MTLSLDAGKVGRDGLIYAESSDEEADDKWEPDADIAEDADDLVF